MIAMCQEYNWRYVAEVGITLRESMCYLWRVVSCLVIAEAKVRIVSL